MESDWLDVAQSRPLSASARSQGAASGSALVFDSDHGLIWHGNDSGTLSSSIIKANLQKYSAFKVTAPQKKAFRQVLATYEGVLAINKHQVRLYTRGGLVQWTASSDEFADLRCCVLLKPDTVHQSTPFSEREYASQVLVAGNQRTMFRINLKDGSIVETIPTRSNYILLKSGGRYVCAATSSGAVHILDGKTFELVREWKPHSEWISDMDANSEFLVCCGYSVRHSHLVVYDPLAYVYDLRQLRALAPIPFQIGACFVRLHPRMSSAGILVSKAGHMQTIDVLNPLSIMVRHSTVYETQLSSFDLAPSGEALAFTDEQGSIHIWASASKINYLDFGPVEYATSAVPRRLSWSPDVPVSKIGMPYYYDVLASAWPSHQYHEVGAPPPQIDPDVMLYLKRAEVGFWAPNPKKTLRNQALDTRKPEAGPLAAPKFLSEKAREADQADILPDLSDLSLQKVSGNTVPVIYQNVEIKYSRFGVDDFDFKFFNKSAYSGLETHISNSYANSLLQLYRFTPVIRNFSLQHTATSCLKEDCLLCELGFLVDMMEKAAGVNCQATNFLKVFSNLSHAGSLGLLEEAGQHSSPPASMIQSLNRFLSDKIATDYRNFSNTNAMDKALYSTSMIRIRCLRCTNEVRRTEYMSAHDLVYPFKSKSPFSPPTFSQVLMASLEKRENARGWCNECRRYQHESKRELLRSLSAVLLLNTAIVSEEAKRLWITPNWLPSEIGIFFEEGKLICQQGAELEETLRSESNEVTVYELVGVVAEIHNDASRKDHLVALVNVNVSSPEPSATGEWHLFNDFLVQKVPVDDALKFDVTWKLPVALSFQVKSYSHIIDNSWKTKLDLSLLSDFGSMDPEDAAEARPLSRDEAPHSGMTVSLDSEFVCVQDEEYTVKSGGIKETVRPARLALGRLSVLRASGPDSCTPFIDDYIAVSEPVKDHLTAYSGISPGDLDRETSPHRLVSLKAAYKKLWLLLNTGCIFVGHGLLKDFRTINIHVPKPQVIDTVDLFFLQRWGGRKLSLRFLAWLLLDEEIQAGMHDSVEDARTAFLVWQKYMEYVDSGTLDEQLEWIYSRGRDVGWKAPTGSSPPARVGLPLRVVKAAKEEED